MRKTLKRVLERLRTNVEGRFRKPTTTRGGLQQPQRMQAGQPEPQARTQS